MKQISIFIENEKGRLAAVTGLLAEGGVNLRALSIADTTDYGILRIVTDRVDEAMDLLQGAAYLAKVTDVLAVRIEDKPGSLAAILATMSRAGISVEYAYAFTDVRPDEAWMVFRVDDNAKAVAILAAAGVDVLSD